MQRLKPYQKKKDCSFLFTSKCRKKRKVRTDFLNKNQIVAKTNIKERTVKEALQYLEKQGFIKTVHYENHGAKSFKKYSILIKITHELFLNPDIDSDMTRTKTPIAAAVLIKINMFIFYIK